MTRKVAFVTGASRGIGKASAIALAKKGYDIVVTARTVSEGEKREYSPTVHQSKKIAIPGSIETTAIEVHNCGHDALPIRLDLLDRSSIDAAIDRTLDEWGRIDLLLNNGIYQGPGLMDRFLDLPEEAARKIFEANVFAQIHITQCVLRGMLAQDGGIIINMTSGAGMSDPPGPAGEGGWGFAYGASKGALHRMVGILHVEHQKQGIRAYNLNPGYVITEANRALFGADNDLDRHHGGAPPKVPAEVIAWLASSPEAEGMSGQTIDAQAFCKERQLLPDWPPKKKARRTQSTRK